jgi:hypothetical protein
MEASSTFDRRDMPSAQGTPTRPTFIRWLWLWIGVGVLVVLVVIGFLAGIYGAVHAIHANLYEANAAVTGIKRNAEPLPTDIQEINSNLTGVNRSLRAIPGEANQIYGALSSIHGGLERVAGSLTSTSGSLADTSGTLVDTSSSLESTSGTLGAISRSLSGTAGRLTTIAGSLSDTSGKLVTISNSLRQAAGKLVAVRHVAGAIVITLNNAEMVKTEGTRAIWRHVRFANGGSFTRPGFDSSLAGPGNNPDGLQAIMTEAGAVLGGLKQVNGHLLSICQAPALSLFVPGIVRPGPC